MTISGAPGNALQRCEPLGMVYLVGAGPGDPELLTIKSARLLASANIVLHDDLVTAEIVALAGPSAWVLNVGKRCGAKSITQDEINRLMIDFARRGLSVVRLKSGDPLVFGRAGEEMDALRCAGLPFEIVPGITAAFAAAAALQCSLTDRRSASAVLFSSGHHARDSELTGAPRPGSTARNLDASDPHPEPTRIVYMPGRDLSSLAAEWLRDGLSPDLPCVVVSRAALPDQATQRARLADLGSIAPGPAPNLILAGWALQLASSIASQEELRTLAAEAVLTPG
ncbi:MAG TPA: uroporphyrinogen-III C-methyltransferase [Acidisarcina sp.]